MFARLILTFLMSILISCNTTKEDIKSDIDIHTGYEEFMIKKALVAEDNELLELWCLNYLKKKESPFVYRLLGNIYYQKKELKLAEKYYRISISGAPTEDTLLSLVTVLNLQGRYNESIPIYKEMMKMNPEYFEYPYRIAILYKLLGKYKDAINHYLLSMKKGKEEIFVLPHLIDLYFLINDTEKYSLYKSKFEKLKSKKNNFNLDSEESLLLAYKFYNQGNYSSAKDFFEKYMEKVNESSENYYFLADIYLRLGNREMAELNFEKSLDLDKYNTEALKDYFRMLMNEKKFQNAKSLLDTFAKYSKNNKDFPVLKAEFYEETGEDEEAIYLYEQAILSGNNSDSLKLKLAGMYLQTGNYKKSIDVATQIKENELYEDKERLILLNQSFLIIESADKLLLDNNSKDAEALYREAIRKSKNPFSMNKLGMYYKKKSRYSEAISLFEESYTLFKEKNYLALNEILILSKKNNPEKYLKYSQKLQDYSNTELDAFLASEYFQNKEYEKSISLLENLILEIPLRKKYLGLYSKVLKNYIRNLLNTGDLRKVSGILQKYQKEIGNDSFVTSIDRELKFKKSEKQTQVQRKIGDKYFFSGKYKSAIPVYEKILKEYKSDEVAFYLSLSYYYEYGKEKAIAFLESLDVLQIEKIDFKKIKFYLLIGEFYLAGKKLDSLLEKGIHDPEFYYYLCILKIHEQDFSSALRMIQKALHLDPVQHSYKLLEFDLLLRNKKYSRAKKIIKNEKVKELKNHYLCMFRISKGKMDKAFEVIRTIQDGDLKNYYLSQIFYKKKNFESSLLHLKLISPDTLIPGLTLLRSKVYNKTNLLGNSKTNPKKQKLDFKLQSIPILIDDTYLINTGKSVFSYQPNKNRYLWRIHFYSTEEVKELIFDESLFALGNNFLMKINPQDGQILWKKQIFMGRNYRASISKYIDLIDTQEKEGVGMIRLNRNGELIQKLYLNGSIELCGLEDGKLFVISEMGNSLSLKLYDRDLKEILVQQTIFSPSSDPIKILYSEKEFILFRRGIFIYKFRINGSLKVMRSENHNYLYLGSNDRFLYFLENSELFVVNSRNLSMDQMDFKIERFVHSDFPYIYFGGKGSYQSLNLIKRTIQKVILPERPEENTIFRISN
ncbi:MAG: tetratricopeptide repeat protein [Leptospiraceae bacterium]|nr:tetratricopeptide repeat protein [Leptospiraceae bacterium]MCP5511310.1 tetratricopeptide repeat protein [Leptospiraceae bacterium]